jgi:hypothetical protein
MELLHPLGTIFSNFWLVAGFNFSNDHFQGIWGSIAAWYIFFGVYSYVWVLGIKIGASMAGMIEIVFSSGLFLGSFLLMPVVALTPDLILKSTLMTLTPTLTDDARVKEKNILSIIGKQSINPHTNKNTDLHIKPSLKPNVSGRDDLRFRF